MRSRREQEGTTGTCPFYMRVMNARLMRKRKDSPNTKYCSGSVLLLECMSKLVSGDGKPTIHVEPASIGCEA